MTPGAFPPRFASASSRRTCGERSAPAPTGRRSTSRAAGSPRPGPRSGALPSGPRPRDPRAGAKIGAARRIAWAAEGGSEQAGDGIEGVGAVVGLFEREPGGAVREPLSELQVLFAREAAAGDATTPAGGEEASAAKAAGGPPD